MRSGGVGVSSRSGPCSSWGAGRQRPTTRRPTRRSAPSSGPTAGSTASCRADATIERLAEGFDWAEGPAWDRSGGYLLFSDVPRNTVFKWKEGEQARVFLNPSGFTGKEVTDSREPGANGLVFDPGGRLVLCQHGDRRVARLEAEGRFATLADRYQGKRFNSPNDAVFKANGDLYFTDPPYGRRGRDEDPKKELPFNGVYRLAKDGTVTLLTREMTFPNGLAFAPDEETLYVANSDPNRALWRAFDVRDDGTLGEGRVFFDATPMAPSQKGLPDGMKVDRSGNLFAAGPGGVLVFEAVEKLICLVFLVFRIMKDKSITSRFQPAQHQLNATDHEHAFTCLR